MSEGNLGELKERSSSPQGAKLSCSTAPDSRSTETCQRHKFRRSNSGSRAASSPDMQHYTPGQGGDRRSDLQADTVLMPQSDSQQGLRNGYQQMPQWCRDFEAPHSQAGRLLRTESKPKYTSRILAGDELSSLVEIGNRLGIVTPTAEEQLAAPQLPKRLFGRYQSVYKGIRHRRSKNKKMLKWDVIFHAGGVLTKLGTYEDEALGARVWDLQALRVRGAFTWINFPHLRNFYLAELSKIGEKVQGSDEALACQRPLACEVVEPPAVQHRPPATLIVPMNESQHSEGKAVSTAPEAPPPAAVPTQTQPCNLQIPTPGTPQTMSARPPAPAPQLEGVLWCEKC
ncbi:unnamed protein product [Ostreobium quekettii]|uniref:AP2/ERF domain-containing protein n=1 Tax=Ostreobium quekettii TaxID=121088 RepID=A0A8S1IKM1_9CHLO|nr:unnamed protein product [Ostreobium quekettii]